MSYQQNQLIQVEQPQVKGHMVNIHMSFPTRPFKVTKAMRKQWRKDLQNDKGNHPMSKLAVSERGAAKILGLCSSHIYATKPE